MEISFLIGVLLACAATGVPVKEKVPNDIFTPLDYALFENATLYVYGDNGELVRLTLYDNERILQKDIKDSVLFYLYTKEHPSPRQLYVNDEAVLKKSNFDPTKPTRFITHGWINSRSSEACTLIRDAYIEHGDYNVIVIDWSEISMQGYVHASTQVVKVGPFVSTMIDFLEEYGMDLSQTMLIGHSLGAHVVGLAARNAKGEVDYVVGLDPALPGFRLAGPGSRISKDDAKHVEIIHTNGGLLGFLSAIGHADFYPNGGQLQLGAGCVLDPAGACSHARSYKFFAESLNSPLGFYGKRCSSFLRYKIGLCENGDTSLMGGHKQSFYANGSYYFMTKSRFPFANGPFGRRLNSLASAPGL